MKHDLQFNEEITDDGYWRVTCTCGWTGVALGEVPALNKLSKHEQSEDDLDAMDRFSVDHPERMKIPD